MKSLLLLAGIKSLPLFIEYIVRLDCRSIALMLILALSPESTISLLIFFILLGDPVFLKRALGGAQEKIQRKNKSEKICFKLFKNQTRDNINLSKIL
tara:strand:+ start:280 stop:570 length:291 start_codon:yes stop_codon:yes gene_type:complete